MNLSQIIAALQAQIDSLSALQQAQPQFSQADLDAAKAEGHAAGLADAATVLGADVEKLKADIASLSPAAPVAEPVA